MSRHSILTPSQRALASVVLGDSYQSLPLADVKHAVRLVSHACSLPGFEMANGSTLAGESELWVEVSERSGAKAPVQAARLQATCNPTFDRVPGHVLAYVLRETKSRAVKVLMRQAIAADIHDCKLAPRDTMAGKVHGEPRHTAWQVDDYLDESGKLCRTFKGSGPDHRQAIRDLKAGKATKGAMSLLAVQQWARSPVVQASQLATVQRKEQARMDAREVTSAVLSDESRRKKARKKAKRQQSRAI